MQDCGVFNYNVGVLGHVDSGKTSLVRVMSSVLSTAALDKNPQSQERGITLDLGFSSFSVPMPSNLSSSVPELQVTLVDCPGHASLIRTIIAGASIIDKMLLVIDATKGVQTQTAECIVIGELMIKSSLVVALNKIDLIPADRIPLLLSKLSIILDKTHFVGNYVIIPVSAVPREGEPIGINSLKSALVDTIQYLPIRDNDENLYFAIDHCFPIKGQGTVITGTVLHGCMKVGDTIEIIQIGIQKKIKSMQSFHKPVSAAYKGDRVGVCVTQFDSKLLERGIACKPGTLKQVTNCIVDINLIPHYKGNIKTKKKFHITCGNETVMGSLLLFSCNNEESKSEEFSSEVEYLYEEDANFKTSKRYFALIQLEQPICMIEGGLLMGSKLDADIHIKSCRIAFHGKIHRTDITPSVSSLKIYKTKSRKGAVERWQDEWTAICRDMFTKNSNIDRFIGLSVSIGSRSGRIEGSFGKSGKFRVRCDEPGTDGTEVELVFKKFLFDKSNKLVQ